MKEGQVGIEALFAVGTIFFIFLFVLALTFSKSFEVITLEKNVNAKGECFKLSSAMISALINGNTTKINSTINQNITIFASKGIIALDNYLVTCTLPFNQTFDAELIKGEISIENKNNFIEVKNV